MNVMGGDYNTSVNAYNIVLFLGSRKRVWMNSNGPIKRIKNCILNV